MDVKDAGSLGGNKLKELYTPDQISAMRKKGAQTRFKGKTKQEVSDIMKGVISARWGNNE